MFFLVIFSVIFSSFTITLAARRTINEKIVIEQWGSEKTQVVRPRGITVLDDYIYVTDKKSNSIIVLDKNGTFQHQSSEDELFLLKPTIINTDGESLYVIDSGNNQLKIVSKEFELLQAFNLPVSSTGDEYWDLEVVDEKIYLSSHTAGEDEAVICEFNKGGIVNKIGKSFVGHLSEFNDKLMAIQSFECYSTTDRNGHVEDGWESGKNGLFKVADDELIPEFDFEDKYGPLDFLYINDYIYVFSCATVSIDKYTRDGQYIETVLALDMRDFDIFVQLTSYDDVILVAYPKTKSIYKIELE